MRTGFEELAILGTLDQFAEQDGDETVAGKMEKVVARGFLHGSKKASLEKLYPRRGFHGGRVMNCFVLEKLELLVERY